MVQIRSQTMATVTSISSLSTHRRPLPRLVVPNQWQRLITGLESNHPNSVYYISPSGHVLTSVDEVDCYLNEPHTCKCYLMGGIATCTVFNFDPEADYVEEFIPRAGTFDDCAKVAATLTDQELDDFAYNSALALRQSAQTDLRQLYDRLIDSMRVHILSGELEWMHFETWMQCFDWHRYLVTETVQKFVFVMSPSQMKHYACEQLRRRGVDKKHAATSNIQLELT